MVRFLPSSRSGQPSSPMVARSAGALMGWALAGSLLLSTTSAVRGQGMLPGCRLENGSLQCVPGLTATPQQQIEVLDGEITHDQQAEGRIVQAIAGLKRFAVVGKARQRALLRAELAFDDSTIETLTIHWYRRSANGHWQLIDSASERTYVISAVDAGRSVMAVLTVTTDQGKVLKTNSNDVGPIEGP